MAVPRTRNGGAYAIFFTTELREALKKEAAKQGKTLSRIVREALIPYLVLRGYEFNSETVNPSGLGQRSDLRRATSKELEELQAKLKKKLASKKKKPAKRRKKA